MTSPILNQFGAIREALPQDAGALEALYRQLLPDHSDIRVSPDRLSAIRTNPDSFLLVYEIQGEIVATVHLHLCMDALCSDRPFAVIERVVTASHVRGQGLGAILMRHAEETAKSRGAIKVMLSSNARRADAHRFYEHLGYDGGGSRLFKKYLD
ncbi:GNAT family N-acetyltransferase [Paenibacillus sp. FSL R7-0273]|uniref:GNAT family N-acetyltransferase n=1 Tax=Paenibacillus sp. FSL R7-0273 TaxID=1536772 RepID=UPI000AB85907|nr:GNAT family N-acetyltransferase [Paenibacillus sp. FSL R7-0273]